MQRQSWPLGAGPRNLRRSRPRPRQPAGSSGSRPPHQQEIPPFAGIQEHPFGEAPEGDLRRLPVPGRAEHRKIRPALPDETEELDVAPSLGRNRLERDAPVRQPSPPAARGKRPI